MIENYTKFGIFIVERFFVNGEIKDGRSKNNEK